LVKSIFFKVFKSIIFKKISELIFTLYKIFIFFNIFLNYIMNLIGDWGLGIGDWGLGIGDWANPQSPFYQLKLKELIQINSYPLNFFCFQK